MPRQNGLEVRDARVYPCDGKIKTERHTVLLELEGGRPGAKKPGAGISREYCATLSHFVNLRSASPEGNRRGQISPRSVKSGMVPPK